MTYLSPVVRQQVFLRAGYRCEYCGAPAIIGISIEVDHLNPLSAGGDDELGNLGAACDECNGHKLAATTHIDPETGLRVSLFNPRSMIWREHFSWSEDNLQIFGLTSTGRATIERLQLNTPERQMMRSLWLLAGVHPQQTP